MFRMDTIQKATQSAMAAEIRARLGRANRTQAWLQKEAGIKPSSWRRYFVEFSRDLPLAAIQAIARPLDTTAGELLTIAEQTMEHHAHDFMNLSPQERADLDRAIGRNGHDADQSAEEEDPPAEGQAGITGS